MPAAFEPFPEIQNLGRDRLQSLCDEWCRGSEAQAYGIPLIEVRPNGLGLQPVFLVSQAYAIDDAVHFPFDQVVEYIIDRAFRESDRPRLKRRLKVLRHRAGVSAFQRYRRNVLAYTMALRCPFCDQGILSDQRVYRGEEFHLSWADVLACPRCGHTFRAHEDDFFPVIDPSYARSS